jgi:hypothetical protein
MCIKLHHIHHIRHVHIVKKSWVSLPYAQNTFPIHSFLSLPYHHSQIPNNNHKPQLPLSSNFLPFRLTISVPTRTHNPLLQHKRTTLPSPTLAEIESIRCRFVDTQHSSTFTRRIDLEVCFDSWATVDVGWESRDSGATLLTGVRRDEIVFWVGGVGVGIIVR